MRTTMRSQCVLWCMGLALLAAGAAWAQGGADVKANGVEPTLTVGGLIQTEYEGGDRGDSRWANDDDRFFLRRVRLNAQGRFAEDFDFKVELELAGTLSNTTALRAQLTDGYVTWNHFPEATLRAGQFKTPFGFEQLYPDPRLITIERSLVNDRLTLNRQLGGQVAGDLFDKRLSYAVGEFNGNGANNDFNDNAKFVYVGRLSAALWQGQVDGKPANWSVGANAYSSEDTALSLPDLGLDSTPTTPDKDNLFTGKRRGSGLDSQLHAGPLDLWAEYLDMKLDPTDRLPFPSFKASGWYVQGSWIFAQRFQPVVKVESFDPDDRKSRDVVTTQTFGFNYLIRGNDLKLMVDYLSTDLGAASPLKRQEKVLARMQVIF